jgi:hypothetical protein
MIPTMFRQRGMLTPALIGLFPLWWAMGLSELIWPAFGLLMIGSLLQSQSVAIPRFAMAWVVFLLFVAASGFMLEEQQDVYSWVIRFSQYVSVGLIVPYVLTHRDRTPARVVFGSVTALFIASVIGGYLGLLLGDFSFRSPLAYVLPGGFQANSFVRDVVNPSFADIERFLGRFEVTRPKAPFTYTNGWGAAMGLLFPFAVHDAITGFGLSRKIARVALVASVVPIMLSLNQGLWISIAAGAGYAALRAAGRGDSRVVLQLMGVGLIATIALTATPLSNTIQSDLQNPNATEDRFELYEATLSELPNSPIIGFGGPREVREGLPPAGTHGQLWIVLFSHGAGGALAYFAFIAGMFWSTRRYRTNVGLWCHVVIFVSFAQAPFYGHTPQQLAIIMVAAAVGLLDVGGLLEPKRASAERQLDSSAAA